MNKLRFYPHFKIKNITVLLSFFILFSYSCTNRDNKLSSKFDCNSIVGKWTFKNYRKIFLNITSDSLFIYTKINNAWNKVLKDRYYCNVNGDTIFIKTNNSYQLMFINYKSCIVLSDFKTWENKNRLDEIYVVKNGNSSIHNSLNNKPISSLKDIIILPDGFQGVFAIAFSQKNGYKIEYDSNGNRVFRFNDTSNLLLRTKANENIFNIATSNIKVFYEKNQNNLVRLPVIDKSVLINGKTFINDTVYVINMGFNQIGRKTLNSLLKININGNIAFFKVEKHPKVIDRYDKLKFRY